ncbi:epimerase [Pseudooceanicola onchidii]|uniref:epimerase n=1 Tax=Pseudooceanicola onchidii TaxID=2562279 RepID=UPI0010AA5802|nr:epimerase [Pseudooceanicola onchidii]
MTHPSTVLILGATGKFGHHAAQAFETAGWSVRRFDRKTDNLTPAASGADVIVMGWHPPSYETWEAELLPMHSAVIEVAKRTGATVIVPGNVYVFGPDAPEVWSETTPKLATNRLGRLRIEMEEMYRAAGVRTILLRAGDFLDTRASGNWFDRFIAKSAARGSIAYTGPADVPHAWAFLPDMARAAVMLADRRDSLEAYEDVPFEGYTLTGQQLARAIGKALHRDVRLTRFGWWQLRLLRPVMPVLKGVFEMRYLWDIPHRIDGTKLARLCPGFVPTPLPVALRAALAHQLPEAAADRLAA